MSSNLPPGIIETTCRCCGLAIRVPEDDAVDLCGACFRGKGGDSDDPCSFHQAERLRALAYRCEAHEGDTAGCLCCDAVEVRRLTTALEKIRKEEGVVCANFELCKHPACQSSYSSWAISDAALQGIALEPGGEIERTKMSRSGRKD